MSGGAPKVYPITLFIDPNEPVWEFFDVSTTPWVATRGGKMGTPESWAGLHRYRIARVNRNDRIAEYQAPSPHKVSLGGIHIPSLWEHTYAELCGIADKELGYGNEWETQLLLEKQGGSTLIADFLDQVEAKHARIRNRSTFGRYMKAERNGFPAELRARIKMGVN